MQALNKKGNFIKITLMNSKKNKVIAHLDLLIVKFLKETFKRIEENKTFFLSLKKLQFHL